MSTFSEGFRAGWQMGYRKGRASATQELRRYAEAVADHAAPLRYAIPNYDCEEELIAELERRAHPAQACDTAS